MRHLAILCTLFMSILMVSPFHAHAASRKANSVPLIVITYNQPRIHYNKQLYQAMSRAVAIKPELMVTVASFIPKTSNSRYNEQMRHSSMRQRQQLIHDLRAIGIPKDRIHVTTEYVTDSKHHELYVYVD
ncbi:MAG: hypothetical protein EAY65_01790 [Alphaproteobacteria bacterium]|nr:MAG: hypothetical protein EAY65_01790 [Alphaproteobacteria bacterium]